MGDYFQFPKEIPTYAMIWMHGLGASGRDMKSIVETMSLDNHIVHHVFMDAPKRPVTINQGYIMPAWYDIFGAGLNDREDKEGIEASRLLVENEMNKLIDSGYQTNQIILAGFSQGAALSLYTALHHPHRLGGVIALSGYLPLAKSIKPILPPSTPIFMAYGKYDSIVMPAWTQQTAAVLNNFGYIKQQVEAYPMDHSVCPEEISALSNWIKELKEEK